MFSAMCKLAVVSALLANTLAASAVAEECEPQPGLFARLKERLDLNPRTSFFGQHKWKYQEPQTNWEQLQRAGNPQCYAPWATCPDDRHYAGYYVGGGAVSGGDARICRREGTWGWDYAPWWSKVKLGWHHGRRHQAGEGQYQPDKERVNSPLDDFNNP
ncbi:MAG: hypothetical protein O3B13_25830 [Planctomycetota bacterium]|nr:hypothetical protein [Planctomycetota bacterium]MDA1166530.1 hypothetical protein [Planctomycetota bacterium]